MELKPCPFCGSLRTEVAYLYFRPYIICQTCHAQIPCYNNYKAAKEAWNRRAKTKKAHWIINGDWGECSSCHESSKLSVMDHKAFCPACGARMEE